MTDKKNENILPDESIEDDEEVDANGNYKCEFCSEVSDEVKETFVYDSPFSDQGENIYLCDECESDSYSVCDVCSRSISDSYGQRVNFKHVEGAAICVRCYQKKMFETGQPKEDFKSNRIHGDFYDYDQLEVKGFQKHAFYSGVRYKREMNTEAIKLIEKGKKVIVNLENISIMGEEGSFSLWVKEDVEEMKRKADDAAKDATSEI